MSDWSSAVSGMVMFRDGEAFLRLTPGAPASSVPTSSASASTTDAATAAPPWGIVRDDAAMMNAIDKNEVQVHSSRLPMSAKDLGTMLNNVQRTLKMTIGKNGEWSSEANKLFLKQLAKCKRIAKTIPQAILDAPLAIEDANEVNNQSQVMDPGNTAEHHHNDDDKAVEHNQDEDDDSDESDSDDGSSTSSSSEASVERKKRLIRQEDTSTWTTGWHDAWESMKLVLDEGFHNKKRRRLAYKVLTALKDAKIEWDTAAP